MGALLFRHRLLVMSSAFLAAAASMVWSWREHASFPTLWRASGEQFPPRITFLITGVLCLVAFTLRITAEARLGAAVYGQGETPRLIDGGPFARTRNPLYLATWLFFTAATAVWAPLVVWPVISVLFFAALHAMVRHEERLLVASLGGPYQEYLQRVPRWLPRLSVSDDGTVIPPDAWRFAVMGNLGFASLGIYRVGVALGGPMKLLGAANLLMLTTWIGVLIMRRVRKAR